MEPFKIIISTRLRNSPVAQVLNELGTEIKYITLRHGEFVLADRFGIMYMTRDDFIDAVKKRTLYREILELKRTYSDPIVVIEGENPLHDKTLDLATIQGAVLFSSALNRVPILTTQDENETAQLLFMMAAQTGSSLLWQKTMPPKNGKVPVSAFAMEVPDNPADDGSGDPRVSIISRLPDVGPTLAAGLLRHFGSLSRLFAAELDDLKKVEGIGPKRAKKIFAFLNGNQAA